MLGDVKGLSNLWAYTVFFFGKKDQIVFDDISVGPSA